MSHVFRIQKEKPAVRCDICHQADCFDATTGNCTRCAGISLKLKGEGNLPGLPEYAQTASRLTTKLLEFGLIMVGGLIPLQCFLEDLRIHNQTACLLISLFFFTLVGWLGMGQFLRRGNGLFLQQWRPAKLAHLTLGFYFCVALPAFLGAPACKAPWLQSSFCEPNGLSRPLPPIGQPLS